jgi:hypothetical protein
LNSRASIGYVLAAAGGVLLFIFTFLSWFGGGFDDSGFSAWEAFSLADIVIAVLALTAAVLAAAHLLGAQQNLPPAVGPLFKWIGGTAALLAIVFILELVAGDANFKFGGILALLAALALLAGVILNERPDLAARVEAAVDQVGGPGGIGGGPAAPGPGTTPQPPAAPAPGPATPPPAAAPAAAPTPTPTPTPTPEPASAAEPAAAPEPAASSGPAAGWYPDPQGQKRLRYWDGSRWTEQTAD